MIYFANRCAALTSELTILNKYIVQSLTLRICVMDQSQLLSNQTKGECL